MPSRKTSASQTASDTGRSSLRRLSSIASFQNLNIFHRRRSNNTTDGSLPSSSSSISFPSSTLLGSSHQHSSRKEPASDPIYYHQDDIEAVPPPPKQLPSRSQYISLPDEPTGGLPRSKTFSNLPLPTRTRARKSSNPQLDSKSHCLLPSTRLPSPLGSTRRYSTRHVGASPDLARWKRLPRSDTEPLLQIDFDRGSEFSRATLFKENISPTPPEQQSGAPTLSTRSFFPSGSYADPHQQSLRGTKGKKELPASQSQMSLLPKDTNTCRGDVSYPPRKSSLMLQNSSPATYSSPKDRPATPCRPQPMQRWNSQPVLTNFTNGRTAHGEIKQARLMSARQAPTPPPPMTPLTDKALERSHAGLYTSTHLRKVSESSPIPAPSSILTQSRERTDTCDSRVPQGVSTAETVTYWTARFSALTDRLRNEELETAVNTSAPSAAAAVATTSTPSLADTTDDDSRCSTPSPKTADAADAWRPSTLASQLSTSANEAARTRRVVEMLYALCTTEDARAGFRRWQMQAGAVLGLPEAARPLRGAAGVEMKMGLRGEEEEEVLRGNGGSTTSAARKMSFVERLLGRAAGGRGAARRRSLVLGG